MQPGNGVFHFLCFSLPSSPAFFNPPLANTHTVKPHHLCNHTRTQTHAYTLPHPAPSFPLPPLLSSIPMLQAESRRNETLDLEIWRTKGSVRCASRGECHARPPRIACSSHAAASFPAVCFNEVFVLACCRRLESVVAPNSLAALLSGGRLEMMRCSFPPIAELGGWRTAPVVRGHACGVDYLTVQCSFTLTNGLVYGLISSLL